MPNLDELRAQITSIDQQIFSLFNQRMQVVSDVASYKAATGIPVYDRTRERTRKLRVIVLGE